MSGKLALRSLCRWLRGEFVFAGSSLERDVMSASSVLFARLIKASVALVVLHGVVVAFPALMSGDPDAARSALIIGSWVSFSVLALLLVVAVPAMILLTMPQYPRDAARRIRWSTAGGLSAGAAGYFFITGAGLEVIGGLTVLGAIAGLGISCLGRESRRWAVN
jgi:hypothetical protein